MKLTFLGAAGTVTGSKYLVESGRARILVDCGLFQGVKTLRLRNWQPPPIEPSALDAVILTHAHLDHSGYLPVLAKRGFAGHVHSTRATRGLCELLLPDSGHLLEEEASYANRHGFSKHRPALPLYTEEEARRSLRSWRVHDYGEVFEPARGLRCRLSRAGHILGSACVILDDGRLRLAFSGDVGRPNDPILLPPDPLPELDHLVVESTYGNRRHPPGDPAEALAEVVRRTAQRRGVLLVPSFAVGRAQTVLHLLARSMAAREIPQLPVYLDSPMAIDATELYHSFPGEHRLPEPGFGAVHLLRTSDESKSLNDRPGPMVIVSASGMASGGRVLHHLKRLGPDPANTVLFVGFQAPGTRGEALVNGAGEVKIHGGYVSVRAEVVQLDSLSAHADRPELIAWLRRTPRAPRSTFVTHGEPAAADALRRHVRDELGWSARVPGHGEAVELA